MGKYAISRNGKKFFDIYNSQGEYEREVEEGSKIFWGLLFTFFGLVVGYVISQYLMIDLKLLKVMSVLLWTALLGWLGYRYHWIIEGVLLYIIFAGIIFGVMKLLWLIV